MPKRVGQSGLEQYGAQHFGILIFATIRKSVGLKMVSLYPQLPVIVGRGCDFIHKQVRRTSELY